MCQSKCTVCEIPWQKNGQIFAFYTVFVHIKYTSNMAACCVNDVTAPHVFIQIKVKEAKVKVSSARICTTKRLNAQRYGDNTLTLHCCPNSTWLVTSRLDTTRHDTLDVSSPCILAVSRLSNSTARHARRDELDMSNVPRRDETSQVEFRLISSGG